MSNPGTASKGSGAPLSHIGELDGIRGIAALMVFFHHAAFATLSDRGWSGVVGVVVLLSSRGNTGVDLFFVLSGFLITSLLIQDRANSRYYQNFYWKRALRILPLYFAVLLITLAVDHNLAYFLICSAFLANFASVFHIASAGPFWTLAIEEQFYLLWPTVIRRSQPARVLRWALLVGLSSAAARFLFAAFGHFNYYLSFLHADGLAFGAALACYLRRGQLKSSWHLRDSGFLLGLLLLGICAFGYIEMMPSAKALPQAFSAAIAQTAIVLTTGACVGLVIAHRGSPWLAFLRSRLLVFFGLISYAFYMVHSAVLAAYDHFFAKPQGGEVVPFTTRLVVTGAAAIGVSLLSRYLIELPAMSLRRYVLYRPTAAETQNSPWSMPSI